MSPTCQLGGATIASLIETCKFDAVDPTACMSTTLTAIANGWSQLLDTANATGLPLEFRWRLQGRPAATDIPMRP